MTCWVEVINNYAVAVEVHANELGDWRLYFEKAAFDGGASRLVNQTQVSVPFQVRAEFGSLQLESLHQHGWTAPNAGSVRIEYPDLKRGSVVVVELNAPLYEIGTGSADIQPQWTDVRANFSVTLR
jgi:hypothetical protein